MLGTVIRGVAYIDKKISININRPEFRWNLKAVPAASLTGATVEAEGLICPA